MKLSQAAMETLSIIAYNQPLSRSDIELLEELILMAVRTLIARGLIEAKDVENSRSHALQTTDLFLNVFGIEKLKIYQQLKKMKKKWMISLVI